MAFNNVEDALWWYLESKDAIRIARETMEDESLCGPDQELLATLEILVDFYDPLKVKGMTEYKLYTICKALLDGDPDWKNLDGVDEMYGEFYASGRIGQPIKLSEMAKRLGFTEESLRRVLRKHTPPVEYAWRLSNTHGGGWRFELCHFDNFKRWLGNLGREKK